MTVDTVSLEALKVYSLIEKFLISRSSLQAPKRGIQAYFQYFLNIYHQSLENEWWGGYLRPWINLTLGTGFPSPVGISSRFCQGKRLSNSFVRLRMPNFADVQRHQARIFPVDYPGISEMVAKIHDLPKMIMKIRSFMFPFRLWIEFYDVRSKAKVHLTQSVSWLVNIPLARIQESQHRRERANHRRSA